MFDPAVTSKKIKDEFVDYISTTFSFADQEYQKKFREELNNIIANGPIVDIKQIFKTGQSIDNLIQTGVLSPLFRDLEKNKPNDDLHKHKLPIQRPLYLHQIEAIDQITTKKNNAIVSTGTGSGKTECFLIPIINELLREVENDTLDSGVRAILIYPMNALANDQMKRLRQILMYYPKITFGVYNGDTEYKYNEALSKYKDLHSNEDCDELKTPLVNELISREQMQNTPPNILCTNYAMLEQMLLRPENDKIFANSNFKYIVLDEAHIYAGATGMETALLLRRLKARVRSNSNINYILTSATLGEKNKDDEQILAFAKNLCGTSFNKENIIYGHRQNEKITSYLYDNNLIFSSLCAIDNLTMDNIKPCFAENNIKYDKDLDVAANLYHLCKNSKLYMDLINIVKGPLSLNDLSKSLGNNITVKDIINFIHICMMANNNGQTLIDAKYHFFIRALEGAYITLTDKHHLFLHRKNNITENGINYKIFEIALCKYCGEFAIVGKIVNNDGLDRFEYVSQYDDKDIKYLTFTSKDDELYDEEDEIEEDEITEIDEENIVKDTKKKKEKIYHLCPQCGAICDEEDGVTNCGCSLPNIRVKEIENNNDKCLNCQVGHYNRFYLGNEAATAVLATALFEELPTKIIKDFDGDVFVERQGGKQFLAFSDSRSDAAFFASYMDKSYKEFLRRRGLVNYINKNRNDLIEYPTHIDELAKDLSKIFIENGTFKELLSYDTFSKQLRDIALRNAWIAILDELVGAKRPGSLTNLGYLKFEYAGNDEQIVNFMLKKYGSVDFNTMQTLLNELAMTFAYFGAIETDNILEPEDKRYIFYTEKPKYIVRQKDSETNKYNGSWMARNKIKEEDKFYKNARQILVSNTLKCSLKEANEFLDYYFNEVLLKHKNYKITRGSGDFYHMPSHNFIIKVQGDPTLKHYICNKCHRITTVNINNQCPKLKCGGQLEEMSNIVTTDNHYINLYNKSDLFPLIIKEHTAQLSREEGLSYQQMFEKNRINALSCSTTFEMGVDVGDLETVFLRNVPPSTANYAQRAGRAGRSKNTAAYALTYAKLSSHDFNFFNNPLLMINGKITAPLFKTDNRKIVFRHIFAVALSYFFKEYPNYFNNNKASFFLENNGIDKLKETLDRHPEELKTILIDSFGENLNKEFNLENFGWIDDFVGTNGILTVLIEDYQKTVFEFKQRINESLAKRDLQEAAKIEKRLNIFKSKKLIDFLARGNVLPKYGFPVDTVELEIANNINSDDKKDLQLTRDLKMAISEYAPGEKVVANNNLYTSRYIKHSIINGKYAYNESAICKCENCNTWNYSESGKIDEKTCVACGNQLPKINWMSAIEPNEGFITDGKVEEVPMKKPEKIYRNDDSYIGNKKAILKHLYNVNGHEVILKSTENDQILVTSKTAFFVCPLCGFSYGILDTIKDENGKKDKEAMKQIAMGNNAKFITPKKAHRNSYGLPCKCNKLDRKFLYHVFNTDVLIMEFDNPSNDENTMISVMYALLNSISKVLDIERSDINGCLKFSSSNSKVGYNIVLYDSVAGGAGHVRRLLEDKGESLTLIFEYAIQKLSICNCDSSCYNCLRSYDNQKFHDILDRNKALNFLKEYKDKFVFDKLLVENNQEETIKISIIDHGQSLPDKSVADNLKYLIDEDDETIDYSKLNGLIKTIDKKPINSPDYLNAKIRDNQGNVFVVDLIWDYEKVILLLPDKKDVYNKIKFIKDYEVFCLDSSFDEDEFLKALRR